MAEKFDSVEEYIKWRDGRDKAESTPKESKPTPRKRNVTKSNTTPKEK